MFWRSAASAGRAFSTNTASTQPRDSASRPSAPEPAYRSRARAKAGGAPRMLNTASLTRSAVGRVAAPRGARSGRPPSSPPTMRTPLLTVAAMVCQTARVKRLWLLLALAGCHTDELKQLEQLKARLDFAL